MTPSASSIEALSNLQLSGSNGKIIPLSSVAVFHYDTEQPVIYQRNQVPTITVSGAIRSKDQPATLVAALAPRIADYTAKLPAGYSVAVGGAVEESGKSQAPIAAVVPLMLLCHADADHGADAGLPADVRRALRRAAGPDRGGRGAAAVGCAAGLRRDPRGAGAGRHPDPQLDHSGA